MQVLGAHMLEICPSIAGGKPSVEIHALGIGGIERGERLLQRGVRIGEAAGPMIAGFLIGDLGYATTFDVLAAVIALVTVGLMVLAGRKPAATTPLPLGMLLAGLAVEAWGEEWARHGSFCAPMTTGDRRPWPS